MRTRQEKTEYDLAYYQANKEALKQKDLIRRSRFKSRLNTWVNMAKKTDLKHGLPAPNIDVGYLNSIWPKDSRCKCCGVEMTFDLGHRSNRNTASLDEVIYGKGHIKGNLAFICVRCNTKKSNMPYEFLFALAAYVDSFRNPHLYGARP